MRRFVVAVFVGLSLVFGAVTGVTAADNAGPCNESGEPGHSDLAQHHIVPLAHAGELGAGGHVPGGHQGFAACQ